MLRDTAQTAQVRCRAWEVQNVTTVSPTSARPSGPLGGGTRRHQFARDAQGCGTLENASCEPLWLHNDAMDLAPSAGRQNLQT